MSLFEALLGAQNPITQWTDRNSNLLTGLGTSLLSDGMNFAPAQAGAALDQQAARQRDADAKLATQANATQNWLQANHPDLAQMVQAGMPVSEAWSTAMQRMQPQGGAKPMEINGQLVDPSTGKVIGDYRTPEGSGDLSSTTEGRQTLAAQFGLEGEDAQMYVLTGKLPGSNQSVRAGVGQPIFGKNRKTQAIEPWQSMTDGTMVNTANPQANPADYDFNPGIASGARTEGTVDAKTSGAARAALPGAQIQRDTTLSAIDRLTNNQGGLNEWFGQAGALPRGMYIQGGSKMGNWVADFSQAEGQAFLQARQFLKGQGAITEVESAKAELAYSRMAAAKQSGDKQNFLQAAADFKQAVEAGYAKLEATAQGAYAAQPPAALTSGNVDNLVNKWLTQ